VDALFVIDEEYASFGDAWNAALALLRLTGSESSTVLEPLRVTLPGPVDPGRLAEPPDEIGPHVSGPAAEPFLGELAQQCALLEGRAIRYRITPGATGDALRPEIRFDPPAPAYLALPIDDAPKKVSRQLARYQASLASVIGGSGFRLRRLIARLQTLADGPPLGAPSAESARARFSLRFGKVGTHDLVTEIRIEGRPPDLPLLARALAATGSSEPAPLHLQFHAEVSDLPAIRIDPSRWVETTVGFRSLGVEAAARLVGSLGEVRDTYSLLEQPNARVGEPCEGTYMLRRTPDGRYEVRVHLTWESDRIDPEAAVAPIEKQSGLAFVRIA
jgi:hypothetical protein